MRGEELLTEEQARHEAALEEERAGRVEEAGA